LRPLGQSPELSRSALAGHVPFVSVEDHVEPVGLDDGSRAALLAAVRSYAAVDRLRAQAALVDGLRRITVDLLCSREERLAAWALRDLTAAALAPLVGEADLPRLLAVVDDPVRPMVMRAGLLLELERRRLVHDDERWRAWLASADPGTAAAALELVAHRGDTSLTGAIVALTSHPDPSLREAASLALGQLGGDAAVLALAARLADPTPRVAHAAVRALGQTAAAEARGPLARAARAHPDEGVRRAATAELAVMQSRTPAPALGSPWAIAGLAASVLVLALVAQRASARRRRRAGAG
jgi:hypothetical protein